MITNFHLELSKLKKITIYELNSLDIMFKRLTQILFFLNYFNFQNSSKFQLSYTVFVLNFHLLL